MSKPMTLAEADAAAWPIMKRAIGRLVMRKNYILHPRKWRPPEGSRRWYIAWRQPDLGIKLESCNAPLKGSMWAAGYRCGKYVMSLDAYGIELEE